jgi:hypothetical protein
VEVAFSGQIAALQHVMFVGWLRQWLSGPRISPMAINFPRTSPVLTTRGTVAFYACLDDQQVLCEISAQTLFRRFGARGLSAVALVRTFEDNRRLIETTAAEVLTARLDSRQSLLLATSDFAAPVSAWS